MKVKNQTNQKKRVMGTAIGLVVLALAITLGVYSCTKHDGSVAAQGDLGKASALKTNSVQALPQGKARFSVVLGRMDNQPWVRIGNWTFSGADSSISATFWTWKYNEKHDVQTLNTHFCNMNDGVSPRNVFNWTLYGWQTPASLYDNWSGNYTYNATTGRLHINWKSPAAIAGSHEEWDVSLPDAALARVKFVSGTSTYSVTHGRGYGSNAPWPNNTGNDHPTAFKTIDEIPSTLTVSSTTGRRVKVAMDKATGVFTYDPNPTGSSWAGAAWNGHSNMTTPSSPTPKNTLQYWDKTAVCNGDCNTSRVGIVYHWTSTNTNRQMSWVNFCACLPSDGGTAYDWPGYGGNMHPQAQFQILDDNSVMRGVIGVESQNPPSTGLQHSGNPGFQMQLQDFTTLSGS
jgi:hypothetical protein